MLIEKNINRCILVTHFGGNETTQQTTTQQRLFDSDYLTNDYSTRRQFNKNDNSTNQYSTNHNSTIVQFQQIDNSTRQNFILEMLF